MWILSWRARAWLLLLICALALAACGQGGHGDHSASSRNPADSGASGAQPAKPLVSGLPDFSRLVRRVAPAVVNISASSGGGTTGQSTPSTGQLRDWLRHFFDDPGSAAPGPSMPEAGPHVSLGSGFIISPDGYILTNRHVIAGAGQIIVKLNDRRQFVARVVGSDPDTDVALLKIAAGHLPTVRIGDPGRLPVGAWVVAIGSPFGFETSVTAGIVSAKRRSLSDDQYVPFLQTDVAINPGNSGGPLFDMAGEVVGINAQIYSDTGGFQGVSFAIPIDVAMNVAHQLRTSGHVTHGWLGVEIQDVDRDLAGAFAMTRPEGGLVTRVFAHSPAARAGLQEGDVILAFNGRTVDSAADLPPLVGALAPGDGAKLKVLRAGHVRSVKIRIAALPAQWADQGDAGGDGARSAPDYGLGVANLSKRQRRGLGLGQAGVRVVDVAPGVADDAGLQPGDVILSVGPTPVTDRQDLFRALHRAHGPVALLVLRHGLRRYLPMQTKP